MNLHVLESVGGVLVDSVNEGVGAFVGILCENNSLSCTETAIFGR